MSKETVKKIAEKIKEYKYVAIVVLCGVLLMLIPGKTDAAESSAGSEPYFSLEEQEKRLEDMLERIEGAGKVKVMLTLKTSTEQILAGDEDTDSNGDVRRETVIISSGTGKQGAVTIKYVYPVYMGAAIVAQGADSAAVRLAIIEMTSAATGLEADRISVMKMND